MSVSMGWQVSLDTAERYEQTLGDVVADGARRVPFRSHAAIGIR